MGVSESIVGYQFHFEYQASGPLVQDVSPTNPVLDTTQSFNVVLSSDWSSDRFTGKPYSSTTGFYYDYQRWYDPSTGRFISQDPLPGRLSLPQSQNPYVYVVNQPTRLTDPSGATLIENNCGDGCVLPVSVTYSVNDVPVEVNIPEISMSADEATFGLTVPGDIAPDTFSSNTANFGEGVDQSQPEQTRVPNPNGRSGGFEHQAMRAQVIEEVKGRLNFRTEVQVKGPGINRFIDVVGYDKVTNEPVEYYQIGKETLEGSPVSREVNAIYDIQSALGDRDIIVRFIPYNWWQLP